MLQKLGWYWFWNKLSPRILCWIYALFIGRKIRYPTKTIKRATSEEAKRVFLYFNPLLPVPVQIVLLHSISIEISSFVCYNEGLHVVSFITKKIVRVVSILAYSLGLYTFMTWPKISLTSTWFFRLVSKTLQAYAGRRLWNWPRQLL